MDDNREQKKRKRLPPWLRNHPRTHEEVHRLKTLLRKSKLHTVCESARCPNLPQCFARPTATFLLLGDRCTRNCRFCAVPHGPDGPPDPQEPFEIAKAVIDLGLKYVVLTSVTRDDLDDGGADHFAKTVSEVHKTSPGVGVEVLVPDFLGKAELIKTVLAAKPNVFNHNVETVPRLYGEVRPQADYNRSLQVLRQAKEIDPGVMTKSGLMVGLGETFDEVVQTLSDLRKSGCDIVTIGQYLQPGKTNLPVNEYIHPEIFARYEEEGTRLGFKSVFSGPLVRSSFFAETVAEKAREE